MFKQRVRVSNQNNPELYFEDDFWVDTRALYSYVPENLLQKISAEPLETLNVVLADGRIEKRLFGYCNFQILTLLSAKARPCPVIFGPPKSLLLLGATTLENFTVEVDPLGGELKPILAITGGFIASR